MNTAPPGPPRLAALAIARDGEHQARRWENPLSLPTWVIALWSVLAVTDAETCPCTQCTTAGDRERRDNAAARRPADSWSGQVPLPPWWDGTGDAESACAAPGWDDLAGLAQLCGRPAGHGGRHMAAFTTTFAGRPPQIVCAWPGTAGPARADLTGPAAGHPVDQDGPCVMCGTIPAFACEVEAPTPWGATEMTLCEECLDDVRDAETEDDLEDGVR